MTDAQPNLPPPPPPTKPTKYCRQCLYPLDGLPQNRCPECGTRFHPHAPGSYRRTPAYPTPWQCILALRCALGAWVLTAVLILGVVFEVADSRFANIFLMTLASWAGITLLAVIFGIVGVTRPRTFAKKRGWIALAVAALPFCCLVTYVMAILLIFRHGF